MRNAVGTGNLWQRRVRRTLLAGSGGATGDCAQCLWHPASAREARRTLPLRLVVDIVAQVAEAVVVYQLLAGTLPFRGSTVALLQKHSVAEVPALPEDAGVPPAVEAVVRRALAKKPQARYQSAVSVAAALRAHAMAFGEIMRRALSVYAGECRSSRRSGPALPCPGSPPWSPACWSGGWRSSGFRALVDVMPYDLAYDTTGD